MSTAISADDATYTVETDDGQRIVGARMLSNFVAEVEVGFVIDGPPLLNGIAALEASGRLDAVTARILRRDARDGRLIGFTDYEDRIEWTYDETRMPPVLREPLPLRESMAALETANDAASVDVGERPNRCDSLRTQVVVDFEHVGRSSTRVHNWQDRQRFRNGDRAGTALYWMQRSTSFGWRNHGFERQTMSTPVPPDLAQQLLPPQPTSVMSSSLYARMQQAATTRGLTKSAMDEATGTITLTRDRQLPVRFITREMPKQPRRTKSKRRRSAR